MTQDEVLDVIAKTSETVAEFEKLGAEFSKQADRDVADAAVAKAVREAKAAGGWLALDADFTPPDLAEAFERKAATDFDDTRRKEADRLQHVDAEIARTLHQAITKTEQLDAGSDAAAAATAVAYQRLQGLSAAQVLKLAESLDDTKNPELLRVIEEQHASGWAQIPLRHEGNHEAALFDLNKLIKARRDARVPKELRALEARRQAVLGDITRNTKVRHLLSWRGIAVQPRRRVVTV